MKTKVFALILGMIFFSTTCQARISCEWENDNAVSYTALQDKGGTSIQVFFVNYAMKNAENEYWIRLASGRPDNKILHWASLFIDGTEYKLKAIDNPSEKYTLAGSAMYNFLYTHPSTIIPRYFPLSPEIVARLHTAKEIYIVYNMQTSINRKMEYSNDKLVEVKDVISRSYGDFNKYWQPKDRSSNGSKAQQG